MQQAYTEGHYLERLTPILGLCHGVFTERFIFRLSFRGKQATRARLGNTIHETRRKKWPPYAGTSSYQNYSNSAFAIFQYSNPSFPYIFHYPLQSFHACEKIRGSADRCFIFELSSSQESSSIQSVKVSKGNFATQD